MSLHSFPNKTWHDISLSYISLVDLSGVNPSPWSLRGYKIRCFVSSRVFASRSSCWPNASATWRRGIGLCHKLGLMQPTCSKNPLKSGWKVKKKQKNTLLSSKKNSKKKSQTHKNSNIWHHPAVFGLLQATEEFFEALDGLLLGLGTSVFCFFSFRLKRQNRWVSEVF